MHSKVFRLSIVETCSVLLGLAILATPTRAAVILSEDFEGGVLDSRISLATLQLNAAGSGIRSTTFFGSTQAFGFGRSNCPASCFFNHTSSLFITFSTPTYVDTLSFKYAELFDNWGSNGAIYLDGAPLSGGSHFARLPSNDKTPDTTFNQGAFVIDSTVSEIELRVVDITNLSEVFIDDLIVTVPEPATISILAFGGLVMMRRRGRWAYFIS